MKQENTDTIGKRLLVPVGLGEAARLLEARHPRWAFTQSQLRRMCMMRSIPYIDMDCNGPVRKHRFLVRVADLVPHFERQEVKAL